MDAPFKFLSISEFKALNPEEKRAYIGEATAELERTRVDHHAGGWHTLFRQERPQPKDKPSDQ
jgi:hypothetical protein